MEKGRGIILSVNRSDRTGTKKHPVGTCRLIKDRGMENDGHAGPGDRQVSLLAKESIDTMRSKGLRIDFGDFAENFTTEGIELVALPLGTRLKAGNSAVLEITRIGKECHERCHIFHSVGDCVMPREGVFARVLEGGEVNHGDPLTLKI